MDTKNYLTSKSGFSLMELIIYIAIFAAVAGTGVGILTIVLRIQSRETSSAEVTQQANFVMQTIQRLVRESSLIEMAAGNSETVLKLRMKDVAVDPVLISADAAAVYLKQGVGATTTLTSSQVKVDGLFFRKYQNPGAHDSVTVDLSLSYNTENPRQMASRTLRSAIARVSAATFDTDLLPGADGTLNIGATNPRWRTLRLSDLLYLGSVASDPGGSNGAVYYNTTDNVFRGYRNNAWQLLGGWNASSTDIYNANSGNVGIGTTTPNNILSVNGAITIASTTPAMTSHALYNQGGSLYWNGNTLGNSWNTSGADIWMEAKDLTLSISGTSVQASASSSDKRRAPVVNGKWRVNSSAVSTTLSGSAGARYIFADLSGSSEFTLANSTSITPGTDQVLVGTAYWDGSAITHAWTTGRESAEVLKEITSSWEGSANTSWQDSTLTMTIASDGESLVEMTAIFNSGGGATDAQLYALAVDSTRYRALRTSTSGGMQRMTLRYTAVLTAGTHVVKVQARSGGTTNNPSIEAGWGGDTKAYLAVRQVGR